MSKKSEGDSLPDGFEYSEEAAKELHDQAVNSSLELKRRMDRNPNLRKNVKLILNRAKLWI